MSKALKPAWSKIPFVTFAYRSIEHLRQLLSQPAARCLSADDQSHCQLSVHAYSARLKCPYGRLVRVRCSTHDSTFTVYPPGLTPYARRLHLPLDRQGNVILNESGKPAWQLTDLEASQDFADGIQWPESKEEAHLQGRPDLPVRKTQQRWVVGLLCFLGLLVCRGQLGQQEQVLVVTGCSLSDLQSNCLELASPEELSCRDGPTREKVRWAANCIKNTRPSTQTLEILSLGRGPEFWGAALRL